jgi:hypothetical protein
MTPHEFARNRQNSLETLGLFEEPRWMAVLAFTPAWPAAVLYRAWRRFSVLFFKGQ